LVLKAVILWRGDSVEGYNDDGVGDGDSYFYQTMLNDK